jgi:hypothetical protein
MSVATIDLQALHKLLAAFPPPPTDKPRVMGALQSTLLRNSLSGILH